MPSLLSAWEVVDSPQARLALVGRLEEDIRCHVMEIAARDPRVTVVDRYVSDSEIDRWVSAADRIVALYDNVGSSGIALRAWAEGKPLLVWAGGSLQASLASLGATHRPIPQENWLAILSAELSAPRSSDYEAAPRVSADILRKRTRCFSQGLIGSAGDARRGE